MTTPSLFHSDLSAQLAHTEEQILCCTAAAENPDLSDKECWGALLGLANWLDNKARILEEQNL